MVDGDTKGAHGTSQGFRQLPVGSRQPGQFIEEEYMLPLIEQLTLDCQRESGNYDDICPKDIFRS